MDKRSPDYVKSSFIENYYGDENSTTYERGLEIKGNDPAVVRRTAIDVRTRVMP